MFYKTECFCKYSKFKCFKFVCYLEMAGIKDSRSGRHTDIMEINSG